MRPYSAKAMKPMNPEFKRESRLNTLETGQAEFANYDITDVASDAEVAKRECNCIIHSGGHKPFSGQGKYDLWSDWEDPI